MNTNSTARIPRQQERLARDPDPTSLDAQPAAFGWKLLPDELVAEHNKGSLPSLREVESLTQDLRIPPPALAFEYDGRLNLLRRAAIVRCGRHFAFARDARCVAGVQAAFTLLAFGTCDDAIDIVAFRPKPNLLLSLLGRVTLVGEDQVLRPHLRRGLRVHRTLRGYLAHRRRGIVIMNSARAALLLHDIRRIPEDDDHREELRRELVAGPIVLERGED